MRTSCKCLCSCVEFAVLYRSRIQHAAHMEADQYCRLLLCALHQSYLRDTEQERDMMAARDPPAFARYSLRTPFSKLKLKLLENSLARSLQTLKAAHPMKLTDEAAET